MQAVDWHNQCRCTQDPERTRLAGRVATKLIVSLVACFRFRKFRYIAEGPKGSLRRIREQFPGICDSARQ